MSNPIKLVINRQARTLVSVSGSVVTIPDLFQSNVQDFEVQIVDPSSSIATPYTAVDMSSYGLRMSIGETPTGTQGGPALLALQDVWSWDSAASRKLFYASLALNTTTIDNYIGSLASKSAYFEVNATSGGNRITLLQTTVTLKAVIDELTSTTPSPTDQYLTKGESLATFAKYANDAGRVITFKSPDGTKTLEIGVADDGSFICNLIT